MGVLYPWHEELDHEFKKLKEEHKTLLQVYHEAKLKRLDELEQRVLKTERKQQVSHPPLCTLSDEILQCSQRAKTRICGEGTAMLSRDSLALDTDNTICSGPGSGRQFRPEHNIVAGRHRPSVDYSRAQRSKVTQNRRISVLRAGHGGCVDTLPTSSLTHIIDLHLLYETLLIVGGLTHLGSVYL